MPTVPIPQRQVGTAALPDVRVSPNAPAAAFPGAVPTGIDVSGAASIIDRVQQEQQQRADQVRVVSSLSDLMQAKNDSIAQLQQARGTNAIGLGDKVQADFRTHVAKIQQTLTPAQQRMFDQHAIAEGLDLQVSVQRHVAGEMDRVTDEKYKGLDAQINNDVLNHAREGDFPAVDTDIAKRKAAITQYASMIGMPDELRDAQIAQAVSQSRFTVMELMSNAGQDLSASAYFKAHKADFAGNDLLNAEKIDKFGSIRGASQKAADTILGTAATLTDAVKAARAIEDPEVRDATEQRVRQDFSERAQAQREQREATYQTATNIVEQTRDVSQVPRAQWANFTVGEREALRNYAEKLTKGTPVETDIAQYYALRAAAISADPKVRDKFLQANLLTFSDALSKSDMKEMIDLQTSMRKGTQQAQEKIAGLRSRDQIATQTFNAAVAAPRGNNPDQKRAHNAEWAQFNSALDARIQQLETDNGGKKAKPDEIQRLADDLVVQAVTTTGQQRRVFESQPGEQLVFSIKDVPFRERQRITKYLQGRGMPTTDANVLKLFTQSLSNTVPPGSNGQP